MYPNNRVYHSYTTHSQNRSIQHPNLKGRITSKPPQHQPTQAQTPTRPPQKPHPQTKHPSKRPSSTPSSHSHSHSQCVHSVSTPSHPPPQSPHHQTRGKTHPHPSHQTGKPAADGKTQRPRPCRRSRRGSLCWIAGRGFRRRGRGGRRLGSGGLLGSVLF